MSKRTSGFIKHHKAGAGFTLIELLIVIGILGILLAIVLVALNPGRQFSQANNVSRGSATSALLNAIHQYAADHRGVLPADIGATAENISSTGANICADLVPDYIAQLPVEPLVNDGTPVSDCAAAYDTGYTVVSSGAGAGNRVTVAAPQAELGVTISVTR